MEHELKIWPQEYELVKLSIKCFEYRINDRDYKLGDTLKLQLFDPSIDHLYLKYTKKPVEYILYGPDFGIPEGFCIMFWRPEVLIPGSSLARIIEALGWQGGTIHQVIDEIKRLKGFEPKEGWTGRQCPQCLGTGEVHHEVIGHEKCSACGGTGDEYGMVCGCCKPKQGND